MIFVHPLIIGEDIQMASMTIIGTQCIYEYCCI